MNALARVAVLGTGKMGRPMAENLAAAGYAVRAWDPVAERAAEVAGAEAFASAAEAVQDADAVMTMGPDGPALEETMFGSGGAAAAMRGGALWLQTATIGPRWAEEFAARAEQAGLGFIDAPVIGSIPAAVSRRLTFFATGPAELREIAEPLFTAMGERTYWYDAPGDGERIKLAINGWIISLAQLAVESLAVTEELGHDPRQFLEILDGHFDGSPLLQVLGAAILDGDFGGGLRVPLAHKDLSLLIDAAEESGGVSLAIAPAVRARLQEAIELGYGDRGATATWFVARAGSGRAAASAAGRTGPRRSEPSR